MARPGTGTTTIVAKRFALLSTMPAGGATAVSRTAQITATFRAGADGDPSKFTLLVGDNPVPGMVSSSGEKTLVFTPNAPLAVQTTYTATISKDIKTYSGLPLARIPTLAHVSPAP